MTNIVKKVPDLDLILDIRNEDGALIEHLFGSVMNKAWNRRRKITYDR